eukprot:g80989.t1
MNGLSLLNLNTSSKNTPAVHPTSRCIHVKNLTPYMNISHHYTNNTVARKIFCRAQSTCDLMWYDVMWYDDMMTCDIFSDMICKEDRLPCVGGRHVFGEKTDAKDLHDAYRDYDGEENEEENAENESKFRT